MAGKLCFDANHPVLAAKETSIDCLETAARETDCGKTANTLKEAIHEHKTPAPREITGDDNNKDACDNLLHRKRKTNRKSIVYAPKYVVDNHRAVAAGDTVANNTTLPIKKTLDDHSAIDTDGDGKTHFSNGAGYDHPANSVRETFLDDIGHAAMDVVVNNSAFTDNSPELVPLVNETDGFQALPTCGQTLPTAGGKETNFQNMVISIVL